MNTYFQQQKNPWTTVSQTFKHRVLHENDLFKFYFHGDFFLLKIGVCSQCQGHNKKRSIGRNQAKFNVCQNTFFVK